MDWKQLKELIELVSEKGFTEFEVERQGFRLRISNAVGQAGTARVSAGATGAAPLASEPALAAHEEQQPSEGEAGAPRHTPSPVARPAARQAEASPSLHLIRSPIVGTFYRAPSPNSDPFVSVGSQVDRDTVVCVIEAMKLMNEIQAEIVGEIVEIYAQNAQAVEYDQPLFGLKMT
jgi:acetyl-CoA carboxylase biotin carboxyl carrier protein